MAAIAENQIKENEKNTLLEGDNSIQESSPPEKLIKHPLQNTWTLWFFKMESQRSWEESQIQIASFDTVEDFWALYNHIELASKLKVGCDYSLFKVGIKPMWEDKRNNQGGRWIINLSKQQRATELDTFWMEMLLLLIGEAFDEHSEEVCGAVVNIRSKGDKVGVWTRDAKNSAGNVRIGHTVKDSLHPLYLGYVPHVQAAKSKRDSQAYYLHEIGQGHK